MNDQMHHDPAERQTEAQGWSVGDATVSPLMKDSRISRKTAASLGLCFVVLLVIPVTQEILAAPRISLLSRYQADLSNYGFQVALQQLETHLVYDSQFASTVRQPYLRILAGSWGEGSRSVWIGSNGFLFHRSDVMSTAGPGILSERFLRVPPVGTDIIDDFVNAVLKRWKNSGPAERSAAVPAPTANSLAVLSDFHEKLGRRGIHLVVVMVPGKSAIYPEELWPAYPRSAGPARNADSVEWRRRLTDDGVDVIDLTDRFWQEKKEAPEPLFLRQDTHWSPRGVAIGAEVVADHLRELVRGSNAIRLLVTTRTMAEPQDLVLVLGLRRDQNVFPQPLITLTQVRPADHADAATGDLAPILLFGDSLTGYYDMPANADLGRDAGFAQQLMLQLHVGVQRFIGFGEESPIVIQEALAKEPSILRHKSAVVLEFASGALYSKRFMTLFSVH